MKLEVSTHGDRVERQYIHIIEERLPAYALIWSMYVGNDSKGRIPGVTGLSDPEKERREKFSQFHYTCLESVIGMYEIIHSAKYNQYYEIRDYICQNNDFIAFMAHMGRIRDNVKKMGKLFGIRDLDSGLEEYWKARCIVLHGIKVPFMLKEQAVFIANLGETDTENTAWDDRRMKVWSKFYKGDYREIAEYLTETYDEVTRILNSCLDKILPRIEEIQTKTPFQFIKPENANYYDPHVSGDGRYFSFTEGPMPIE
jgi:hypothetical protein